ncbi:MAG: bifunctional metallophosphatase/5'-nucleotidase, partial [Novosphingobium sp.]
MLLRARLIMPLALSGLLGACAAPMAGGGASGPVEVGIVGINDFHGSLEPPRQAVNVADGNGGIVG